MGGFWAVNLGAAAFFGSAPISRRDVGVVAASIGLQWEIASRLGQALDATAAEPGTRLPVPPVTTPTDPHPGGIEAEPDRVEKPTVEVEIGPNVSQVIQWYPCCCIAKGVDIVIENTSPSPSPSGSSFTFTIWVSLYWQWVRDIVDAPCRFEWWERTDRPTTRGGKPLLGEDDEPWQRNSVWGETGNNPAKGAVADAVRFRAAMAETPCPGSGGITFLDHPSQVGPFFIEQFVRLHSGCPDGGSEESSAVIDVDAAGNVFTDPSADEINQKPTPSVSNPPPLYWTPDGHGGYTERASRF